MRKQWEAERSGSAGFFQRPSGTGICNWKTRGNVPQIADFRELKQYQNQWRG
jgi:hypothetical protein